ncbi:MAG: ATP-binding protein [Acidimicrobiales bacterium]
MRRFPVDIVKIDRSFVAGLGVDPAAEAIVAAVVNLSHALGLVVVGEGVETEQQLVMLRALGCDRAQGFLWSRALAAPQIRQWRPAEATVESTSVDVRSVLEERVGAWQTGTGRPFLLEGPAQLPTAQADWGAVKTVVDHLLDNAVAFSPADRPVVVSAGAGRRWVRFSVADFGIGMASDEVARCFEQFWQSEAGVARRPGRTGIGLSSVRSLVEAMGGRVAVKSATGKGSTFTVSLPRFGRGQAGPGRGVPAPGIGDPSMVREFMRQIGVPTRREP